MASLPPQNCCTQGIKLEGSSTGSYIDIGSINTYVTGDKTSKNVLLFLTDILGHKFVNSQIVADAYAAQGYYVLVPDLFKGDPTEFGKGIPEGWLDKHGVAQTEPIVDEVISYIKTELKPKQLSSIGYCFGARFVIRLLGDKRIDVGAAAHPSFVQIDEVAQIKNPIIIIGAEEDPIYPPELRAATEAKLKEIKATYFTTLASGTAHGFTVRGDTNDKWISLAVNKAFTDSVWWFKAFE